MASTKQGKKEECMTELSSIGVVLCMLDLVFAAATTFLYLFCRKTNFVHAHGVEHNIYITKRVQPKQTMMQQAMEKKIICVA